MTTVTIPRTQKSTTVRFFVAPWPVRAAFAVLNRTAPALSARWAERIWFTLPRSPAPARAGTLPAGRPFTVEVAGRSVPEFSRERAHDSDARIPGSRARMDLELSQVARSAGAKGVMRAGAR